MENRTRPELVMAEVSGAFSSKKDGQLGYKKFQFSLEVTVLPQHFGIIREKRGKMGYIYDPNTVKKSEKFNKVLRNKIADFEFYIESAQVYFRNENPTAEQVKNYLHSITGREKRKPEESFEILYFLESHIKHLENLIGSGRKDEVKENTINSFRNLVPLVKRYQQAKSKLIFENLNEELYRDFWDVSNSIKTGDLEIEGYKSRSKEKFASNTIKAYQNYFILLCKSARKQNIDIPLDLTDANLINSAEKNSSVKTDAFLKEEDILKVMKCKPVSKNMLLAREYIIIASQTGMRLQSMQEAKGRTIELYKNNKDAFYYLHTIQEKTSTECYTPLFLTALEIIKNNNFQFPDFTCITLANLNINIRNVLNLAEIENSSLFSTHNLRSTFVSNLSLLGLSEIVISSVTHPSKKSNTSSVHIYDRRDMLDKAVMFTQEIKKINKTKPSKLYRFS
ncbi:hypothetical protein [Flavobacterium sp. 245]|uniref:hypothetical protein n=1 Tax=Flavobacterium sp. 245 TaxID=2512115 RepID=UPI001060CACC|nr:hypothetical protein [Flavobacterium sp. 245]